MVAKLKKLDCTQSIATARDADGVPLKSRETELKQDGVLDLPKEKIEGCR
jgi:hypothetical protein